MPLYEYRCSNCLRRFEVLQRVGDGASGLVCPHCGADRLEKEYSTFASSALAAAEPSGGGCGPGARFT